MIKRIPFDVGESVTVRVSDAHGRPTDKTRQGVVHEVFDAVPDPYVRVRMLDDDDNPTFTRGGGESDWIGPRHLRLRANDPRVWMPAQYKDADGQIPVFQRFTRIEQVGWRVGGKPAEYLVVEVGMQYAVAVLQTPPDNPDPDTEVVSRKDIEAGERWRILRTIEEPLVVSVTPDWCKPTGGAFVFDSDKGFREV